MREGARVPNLGILPCGAPRGTKPGHYAQTLERCFRGRAIPQGQSNKIVTVAIK